MDTLLSLALACCPVSDRDEALAWLEQHAVVVRTIASSPDDDFADLAPIAAAIGDARVVQLGEISHGDGSTFLARSRLIQFLHARHGFDVLLFEAGMYSCARMNAALETEQTASAIAQVGLFPLWANSVECQPAFEYAKRVAASERPLELGGFDVQPTGTAAKGYANWLLEQIGEQALDTAAAGAFRDVDAMLTRPPGGEEASVEATEAAALPLVAALDAAIEAGAGDTRALRFARRTLENWRASAQLRKHLLANEMLEASNLRDRIMGENLVWLANDHFKGRRILVWAAARHLCHDLAKAAPPEQPDIYHDMVAMGDVVHRELGADAYTLMFVAYAGRSAIAGGAAHDVEPAQPGSFEALCHRTGSPYLFVDLRGSDAQPTEFPRAPMSARPFGFMACDARWAEIGDAFFFIDVMEPSTALSSGR
jgi:erythromycin esterase